MKHGDEQETWTTIGEMVFVADDQSEVDPTTDIYISMPTECNEKIKALQSVFLWASKSIFFANHCIQTNQFLSRSQRISVRALLVNERPRPLSRRNSSASRVYPDENRNFDGEMEGD
jgi:hypothetical protein